MPNTEIELEYTKSFVDVVFGVLIALPLTEVFPELVRKLITETSLADGESLLLLVATLVFSTFYWFELRRFIDEQDKFDKAIKAEQNKSKAHKAGGLPVEKLLGSLLMVALVAMILRFANVKTLRAFVLANLLFWLIDLFGNVLLKVQYEPADVEALKSTHPDEYNWYLANIRPRRKGPLYSSINIAFFGLALVVAIICRDHPIYVSASVFVFTPIRHFY